MREIRSPALRHACVLAHIPVERKENRAVFICRGACFCHGGHTKGSARGVSATKAGGVTLRPAPGKPMP